MKRFFLVLGLTTLATSTFAYNAQIDGGYTYTDYDNDVINSDNNVAVKGTFYFSPVQSKTGPLNEGAFLTHASNVYGTYNYNRIDSKTYNVVDAINTLGTEKDKYEQHTFAVGTEFFYEQFYFNGQIGMSHEKYQEKYKFPYGSESYKDEYDRTNYRALVGYMPISNLLIAAGIDGYNGDDKGDDDNAFAIKAKYVFPVGNAGQYVNLEADGTFGDVDNYNIGGDYYFDKAFSVGAAYNYRDYGHDDADFFTVRTKYFLNDMFAVGGEVGFGDHVQAYNLNASFRF